MITKCRWSLSGMGHIAATAATALVDNEGLVKTLGLRAKGGSKFHRRKIATILERIDGMNGYAVKHVRIFT